MMERFEAGPGRRRLARSGTPLEALTPPPFLKSLDALEPLAGSRPSESLPPMPDPGGTRVLDLLRQAIQTLHYSRRTERAYAYWVKRFLAHYRRDAASMGADEIKGFLSHLAVKERVTASTQNQALCALVFLYRRVLGLDLESLEGVERAKAPKRLPVVLTRARSGRSSRRCPACRSSCAGSSMARGCAWWNVCRCESRTWTSSGTS